MSAVDFVICIFWVVWLTQFIFNFFFHFLSVKSVGVTHLFAKPYVQVWCLLRFIAVMKSFFIHIRLFSRSTGVLKGSFLYWDSSFRLCNLFFRFFPKGRKSACNTTLSGLGHIRFFLAFIFFLSKHGWQKTFLYRLGRGRLFFTYFCLVIIQNFLLASIRQQLRRFSCRKVKLG